MKHLLVPAALLVLSPSALREEGLEYAPEEDTVLTRTFEARGESELVDVTVEVNGDELEAGPEDAHFEIESLERIVVTDEIVETEDGRPTDLVRTFDELVQEATYSGGEAEMETSSWSPLQGRSVRFLWDDEDEDYVVETDDDQDEIDDELVEWLEADMDLLLLLPDEEVDEGDEWEIDGRAYLAFMWPGGLLDFADEGEDVKDPTERSLNRQIVENLEGEGTATLDEIRDEDGVRVAVLMIELDVETWADEDLETEDGPQGGVELSITRELQGEVLWDLDHGHVLEATLSADAELERTTKRTFETEQGDFEVEEIQTFEGTIEYALEVETQ